MRIFLSPPAAIVGIWSFSLADVTSGSVPKTDVETSTLVRHVEVAYRTETRNSEEVISTTEKGAECNLFNKNEPDVGLLGCRLTSQFCIHDSSSSLGGRCTDSKPLESSNHSFFQPKRMKRRNTSSSSFSNLSRNLQTDTEFQCPTGCPQEFCDCAQEFGSARVCAAELDDTCKDNKISFCVPSDYLSFYEETYCPFAACLVSGKNYEECGCVYYRDYCDLYYAYEESAEACAVAACCDSSSGAEKQLCIPEIMPSSQPSTSAPTESPTTGAPTSVPSTSHPTTAPSANPTVTTAPSDPPSVSFVPTLSGVPTTTSTPTVSPSISIPPTVTFVPTPVLSTSPSAPPSLEPTETSFPSEIPTASSSPSVSPTDTLSDVPSAVPSYSPTDSPTTSSAPTESHSPSAAPSITTMPTFTAVPSMMPSNSTSPSAYPSAFPSVTISPTEYPTTSAPTESPTTSQPTTSMPSSSPISAPTKEPTTSSEETTGSPTIAQSLASTNPTTPPVNTEPENDTPSPVNASPVNPVVAPENPSSGCRAIYSMSSIAQASVFVGIGGALMILCW